jgi:translocation and assembly module TamB
MGEERSDRRAEHEAPSSAGRRVLQALAWAGGVLAALVLVVALGLALLDTPFGHALDARLLARVALPGGAHIHVQGIQGSIWGRMTLTEVTVADRKGVFVRIPRLVLEWRPWALLHKRIVVPEISAETLTVLRRPSLSPSTGRSSSRPPDVALSRLHVGNLWLEPAVTGERRRLGVDGDLTLLGGLARADLAMRAEPVAGSASGDSLSLHLDAQPSRNRLALEAHLLAPAGGVLDRLLGLGHGLTADVRGRGSWAAWNGTANADLAGQPLLRAALTERAGRFSAKGVARPALVATGPAAALTKPQVGFGVVFAGSRRRLNGAVALQSSAMEFVAQGGLDLQHSAFVGVSLSGRVFDPHALAPNLSGRDLRMDATLDGPFKRPTADFRLQAAWLALQGRRLDRLRASGRAVPDNGQGWTASFQASTAEVSGAGPTVAALGRALNVKGTVRLAGLRASAKGVKIESDHLRAKVDFNLAFDTGRYDANIDAAARQVPVKGLGTVDASTTLTAAWAGPKRIMARGHIHARTLSVDNATAAKLLGGQAVLDAAIATRPDGTVVLDALDLAAPKLQVRNGQASYAPDGRISAALRVDSAAYGQLTLKASGSLDAPQATLRADNLAIAGLKGVNVAVNGHGGGRYAVGVQAQSRYGPVSADLDLALNGGALTADVRSATVAGVDVHGTVRRTAAGPFVGGLTLAGRGLSGTVQLDAVGKAQSAVLALRAHDASLPLAPPVTIASGAVNARVTLLAAGPSITGKATLSGVRRGGLVVSRAAVDLTYAAGSGHASVDAAGRGATPFTLALSARFTPMVITVAGGGSADRIPIRLSAPAVVRRTAGGYQLEPAVLTSGRSRIEISGRYGAGVTADLRIDQLDLGLTRAFAPALGLSGRASGTADVTLPAGGGAPAARLRLQIDRLRRSTAAEVSEPVDVTLAADLAATGLDAHALLKRGTAVIGRAQARIATSPTDRRPWRARLAAAPLTGGVRFNGDAQTLWSLSGVADLALSGPIAIGADVSGSLDHPQLRGVVRAKSLRFEDTRYGALIDDIAIDAHFVDTRLQLDTLTGRAGSGSVSASGYADLAAASGFPVDLKIRLDKARLVNGDDLGATVSGQLAVVNGKGRAALISGDLTLDQGRYQIVRQGKDEIVELTGVHRAGQPVQAPDTSKTAGAASGLLAKWRLDVQVHAPQQLFVRGMGLDSEWRSDLRITGPLAHPVVVGDIDLVRGTFSFAGRDLTLSRGRIHLSGAEPPNPTLDIEATATVDDVMAIIDIGGAARHPQITFSSDPALPQDEVLSRVLFGSSVGQLSAIQAVQLAASLNALRGGEGFNPIGKLRQVTGLEQLKFYGADKSTGRGAAVGVGKHIAKNLYVELTTDAQGYTATQIELALTKTLRLLSQVGAFGGTQVELRYSHRY